VLAYLFRFRRDGHRCLYETGETGPAAMPATPTQTTDIGHLPGGDPGDPIVLYALRQRYAEYKATGHVCNETSGFQTYAEIRKKFLVTRRQRPGIRLP